MLSLLFFFVRKSRKNLFSNASQEKNIEKSEF